MYCSIIIDEKFILSALNIILKYQLSYKSIKRIDNSFKIKVSSLELKEFTALFEKNNIKFTIAYSSKLSFFKHFKYRLGFLIGIFLMVAVLYLSSNLVWRIEINGNNCLTDEEVIQILESSNFKVGTFIPRIDYDEMQNKILLSTDKLSWISLNIKGNVAMVEVKETVAHDTNEENKYTNIVAAESGQIVEIKILNGEKAVEVKDVVKEGDLLISGVSDSQSQGVKYTNARGEIYAIVNKDIEISVPYENECKIYTGKVYSKKRIKIFSKLINFSLNNNKYDEFYDKIEKEKEILLFGKYKLPIVIYETRYYQYKIEKQVYATNEVIDIAMAKLRHDLEIELKDAELVSKTIKTRNYDGFVTVNCNVYIIKNIAKEVQIVIEEQN